MKVFRAEIIKTDYPISHPDCFCPVDWWNYQSLYHHEIYKTKFNVVPTPNSDILRNSIGVHLWNNFAHGGGKRTAIDWDNVNKNSLFSMLLKRL